MSADTCSCGCNRLAHPYALAPPYAGPCMQCGKCSAFTRVGELRQTSLDALMLEVVRARKKHPDNAKLLAALMEEVGELAKAMLQRRSREEVEAEAIQVACVALRIVEEGDADFADKNQWSDKP